MIRDMLQPGRGLGLPSTEQTETANGESVDLDPLLLSLLLLHLNQVMSPILSSWVETEGQAQGLGRVGYAASHFDGPAIRWYRPRWDGLVDAMKSHFGPSAFLDYNVELSKIKQKGSIIDYQVRFEELNNMVREWPTKAHIGAFEGELKDETRIEVQASKPRTLPNCFDLER
ncbi:hypothetical protein EJ110_NYTH38904 [Nymphaea thermarum]|nr:hypothetical protein EJ110_NYTH38904 [Nymphaea thermarum]